ncbi:MAG: DUF790 family protein [Magnetococcus sp. YQC-9]
MLNRELLRFDQRQGRLTPRFIDPENALLQSLARDLSFIYLSGEGQTRDALSEAAQPLINAARSPMIAKGLNKLLMDRCTFRELPEGLEAYRETIFQAAGRLLRAEGMDDLTAYRQAVASAQPEAPADVDPDQLAGQLHADHPDRQPLVTFDPVEPAELLHRYNLALAQGPLVWADRLTVRIREPDTGKMRRFFHRIKFLQLLAQVTRDAGSRDGFVLELDGPLSLFDLQRKYGIKLALLLPALCDLSAWSLRAEIRMNDHQPATLELSEASALWAPEPRAGGYIPDEFATFAGQFQEKAKGWEILPHPELLELGGQELVVPDFSFRHASGARVHLELFHRWHARQLPLRLKRLDSMKKKLSLVIGVDRHLTKQAELTALLEGSRWFQEHGFAFNQFPPVKRVVEALEGMLLTRS